MGDLEVLKRYVKIADMTDLRFLAIEYALEQTWECLDMVTDEIEKRTRADRAMTKDEMDRFQKKTEDGTLAEGIGENKTKTVKRTSGRILTTKEVEEFVHPDVTLPGPEAYHKEIIED